MDINKKNRKILVFFLIIVSLLLSSCIPVMDIVYVKPIRFKNCTNDTLFIGMSNYDSIDGVVDQLHHNPYDSFDIDTKNICLWNDYERKKEFPELYNAEMILPDSLGEIDYDEMFFNQDTCYFFLIKYDANNNSWDDILAKRLYKRLTIVRNKDEDMEKVIQEIKYTN